MKNKSYYYQAKIEKKNVVNLIYLLRSIEDNLCFDRCLKKNDSIFEFFVTNGMNNRFLEIMNFFLKMNLISELNKKNFDKIDNE